MTQRFGTETPRWGSLAIMRVRRWPNATAATAKELEPERIESASRSKKGRRLGRVEADGRAGAGLERAGEDLLEIGLVALAHQADQR